MLSEHTSVLKMYTCTFFDLRSWWFVQSVCGGDTRIRLLLKMSNNRQQIQENIFICAIIQIIADDLIWSRKSLKLFIRRTQGQDFCKLQNPC